MNELTAVRDASATASATDTTGSQCPPAVWDEPTAITRAQAGDEAAFEWLYRKYDKPIRVHLFRMLGDVDAAADAAADTFLKIWLALPKTSDDLRFSAWAYRVATNVALDALRRRGVVKWLPLAPLLTAVGADTGPSRGSGRRFGDTVLTKSDGRLGRMVREALTDHDRAVQPEAAAVRHEDTQEVREIMERLHPRYRAALLLQAQRGLTCDEIAAALGTTRGTVKCILFRARAQFRELCAGTTRPPGRALELAEAAAIAARSAPAISGAEVRRRREALGLSRHRMNRAIGCHHLSLIALEDLDRGTLALRRRALAALERTESERARTAA